ncbi:MAG: (2Fe-2S)-binding protein [Deltaproteobacteria bacterium]|nr:(2Fe-2S)-binding protein [Deltaproteobacteria bacterium]
MPTINFLYDRKSIEVSSGTTMQEAADTAGATIPFGCRMGSCGSCRCLIKKGSENVNAPTNEEVELFDNLTSVGNNERLACQIVVYGDVEIQS